MNKRIKIAILFLFIYKFSFCQPLAKNDSILYWTNKDTLVWNYFRGDNTNKDTLFYKAVSAVMINAKGYWDQNLPNYKIICYFEKNNSWTKDTCSINLLKHEQLHFDIGELFARKIRKEVMHLRSNKNSNIEAYANIINLLLTEREEFEDLYDKETGHGVYLNRQKEWNCKVSKELEELKEFAVDYEVSKE